ncbi:MAG: hypothetical protein LBL83_10135 [Clostridiales bacterium]|nr:hypothetical protein [Clostridiales bacterium]
MRENQKIVFLDFFQLLHCLNDILVASGIFVLILGGRLSGKHIRQKRGNHVFVFAILIFNPRVGKSDQDMYAVGAVIHRKLSARKQKNPLASRGRSQGFELAKVELVVVGDNSNGDVGILQGFGIAIRVMFLVAREFKFLAAGVFEFPVGLGVQMKICPEPSGPVNKQPFRFCVHFSPLLWRRCRAFGGCGIHRRTFCNAGGACPRTMANSD